MPQSHDIIVIGAGFAGLACARRAAERGLSVLVLDRQSEPGERIHTTGILVKEAWEEWVAPTPLVRKINRVRVYTPSHQFVELESDGYLLFFSLFQWILPNYSMNSSGRCSNWFTTAGENWGQVKAL